MEVPTALRSPTQDYMDQIHEHIVNIIRAIDTVSSLYYPTFFESCVAVVQC